jgi:hypothetical protein
MPATVFSTEERFQIAEKIVAEVVVWKKSKIDKKTDLLDRILVHPIGGMLILFMVLGLVFQAIFSWAGPLQDGIESLFGWLGGVAGAAILLDARRLWGWSGGPKTLNEVAIDGAPKAKLSQPIKAIAILDACELVQVETAQAVASLTTSRWE